MTAATMAREVRQVRAQVAARMSGRDRGPDRQVRRDSYDVDDPRAQVWRKIEDGSKHGGLAFTDALLQTAEEFDVVHKKPGSRGPLQANGIRVLKVLLTRALDFRTGRSEPELVTGPAWRSRRWWRRSRVSASTAS